MFSTFNINLESLAVHYVGNKADDEGVRLSNDVMHISDEHIKALLQTYFLQLLNRVSGITCIMKQRSI